jgi:glycolate oxidase FAD binding subunit
VKVTTESQAVEFVRQARAEKKPFEIVAGGTRRQLGAPISAGLPQLDLAAIKGIVNYEPEELICTLLPGTPLPEVESVLAQRGQRLGFDPADWSAVHAASGTPTIGGALSVDAFGPGRLLRGPARDSLLAYRGVNGLGETIRGGAKVVKNVTGFDLPKLMCGAFGTLSVLTELTFRVYPRPSRAAILAVKDVGPLEGFAHLRKIARSALEPSGLAYLPANNTLLPDAGRGVALIRLEGEEMPLQEKIAMAKVLLGAHLDDVEDGIGLFGKIRDGVLFAGTPLDVWRIMIPATEASRIAAEIAAPLWLGDQAGGLLWLAAPAASAGLIRGLAAANDGQAMLLKASDDSRASLGLYAPPPPPLAALRARVKNAFDPDGLLNPGRLDNMGSGQ